MQVVFEPAAPVGEQQPSDEAAQQLFPHLVRLTSTYIPDASLGCSQVKVFVCLYVHTAFISLAIDTWVANSIAIGYQSGLEQPKVEQLGVPEPGMLFCEDVFCSHQSMPNEQLVILQGS